jgi:hypothetical protein
MVHLVIAYDGEVVRFVVVSRVFLAIIDQFSGYAIVLSEQYPRPCVTYPSIQLARGFLNK